MLDGLPGGRGLNIAHEAVDRHVLAGRGDHVAIRWIPKHGAIRDVTFSELRHTTGRFASALQARTGNESSRVATLLGRVPEVTITALGTLKGGGVYSPLFSAFGPEPVRQRLDLGRIEVLVTTAAFYTRKVAPVRDTLDALRHIVIVGPRDLEGITGAIAWDELLSIGDPDMEIADTDPEQPALVHFTSGTTGMPKGALHVHQAVVAHHYTGGLVLGLRPDDVYWCTADPGWVTGTSYGMIAPLTHGVTTIVDEGDFDADRWYGIVQDQRVTVWYTAPTAVRMLMRVGIEASREYALSSLRVVASVGEPLNPEAVVWGEAAFGRPILDNWWQTETGGIMIANLPGDSVRPGSMGHPLPGIEAGILARDDDGELLVDEAGEPIEITDPDAPGELALVAGWPSMFRGYLGAEDRYRKCFVGRWYRSGDLARRDADGYYWFVGRGDDVIKSAGHLIGPFEVESVLIEHPAVSEAGVIGKPDETAGNIIKAFVSLAPDATDSEALRRELIAYARNRLGPVAAPREIEVVQQLPRTRSGKIMRRLLRARELGLPEGDLSTLEGPA